MKLSARIFVLIVLCLAAVFTPALAQEEPPGIEALLDISSKQYGGGQGARPSYTSFTPDGQGGGTISGLKWFITQEKVTIRIEIADTVVAGVKAKNNGAYSYQSIVSKGIKVSMDVEEVGPIVIDVPEATTKNLHIVPKTAADGTDYTAFTGLAVYEQSNAPLINISVAGQSFQAKGFSAAFSGDMNSGFGTWNVALESAVIPVSAFPDEKFKRDMTESFGYEKFDVGFDGSFIIAAKDKKIDVGYAVRARARDVGAVEFAFAAQEIPARLAAVLKEIQAGKEPDMGKLMPSLFGIKISRFKLRFVDDSVTNKALDFAAGKQGKTVDALKAEGAAIIQLGLGQLRVPEFTQSVVAAYQAFVKNPGNISVEINPAQPVAIAALMGLMAAPQTAIQTLGVKVEANK